MKLRARIVLGVIGSLAVIAFAVVWLGGCNSYIQVGGVSDSPSGRYSVRIGCAGAARKGYDEVSPKDAYIGVVEKTEGRDGPELYKEHIKLALAGDVDWEVSWLSDTSVSILLYDYGPMEKDYAIYLHQKRRPLEGRILAIAPDKKSFVLTAKTWTQYEDLSKYVDPQAVLELKSTSGTAKPTAPANGASPRR